MQQLEQRLHRQIIKSRPYFEEKSLCNDQLAAQKERVEILQAQVAAVKGAYAASLKELENISEEIHCKRSKNKLVDAEPEPPCGPREPGVGAELVPVFCETPVPKDDIPILSHNQSSQLDENCSATEPVPNVFSTLDAEEKIDIASEACSLPSTPLKPAESSKQSSPAKSNLTSLPLLDNLAHMKNSSSVEMPVPNPNASFLNMSSSSGLSEVLKRSNVFEDDFGREVKLCSEGDEAYNHVLLNHLIENYESELDRCDKASLSGTSVATGSSAVSEKDESEYYLNEVRS